MLSLVQEGSGVVCTKEELEVQEDVVGVEGNERLEEKEGNLWVGDLFGGVKELDGNRKIINIYIWFVIQSWLELFSCLQIMMSWIYLVKLLFFSHDDADLIRGLDQASRASKINSWNNWYLVTIIIHVLLFNLSESEVKIINNSTCQLSRSVFWIFSSANYRLDSH